LFIQRLFLLDKLILGLFIFNRSIVIRFLFDLANNFDIEFLLLI